MTTDPIKTWRIEDAPELYRNQLAHLSNQDERGEFKWVTWLPTEAHLAFWWGDRDGPSRPGSMAQNLRAGVAFFICQLMDGYLVLTTNNDEDREIASGG